MGCVYSRPKIHEQKQAVRRRRQCKDCGFRITTVEVQFTLVKKAANRRKYWREYKRKKRCGDMGAVDGCADASSSGLGGSGIGCG